jgi:tRNA U34 5-methylaminomethyl-2-thiouridine-forming methyltransferase MnmC
MKNDNKNQIYKPLTPEEGVISLVREWSIAEINGDETARQCAQSKIKKYMVKTADGSFTLRSQMFEDKSETMHTIHGAFYEAREKFVKPAFLQDKKTVEICDICSGLGINAAAALEKLLEESNNVEVKKITLDMIEISWETLAVSLILPSTNEFHDLVKKAIEDYLIQEGKLIFAHEEKEIPDHIEINVQCEDAREIVREFPKIRRYDAIFLDPFSPTKSPELYSYDFLLKISSLLKEDGVILTYTASAPVRYALMSIGLEVGEGPAIGRSGGTIASFDLNKITQDLSSDDERMIALSDAGIPFRDPELVDSSKIIHDRRYHERIAVRGFNKMPSTVKTPTYLHKTLDDERTKRRVLNHLNKFKIYDLNSEEARFLVCPQFVDCICHCNQGRLEGSRRRVKEMENRLKYIVDVRMAEN